MMMNDKGKLNINAPLMSMRRSSGPPLTSTEAKRKILENALALPYMTTDQVTEPVAVPFNWEHIPGRSKVNGGSEPKPPTEPSITPTPSFPPGNFTSVARLPLEKESKLESKFRSSSKTNSLGDIISKIDSHKEQKDEKLKILEEDDDYEDDVYSDALETLSPTESFFMNCSVSDVSGLDNLDANKCRESSIDKQAQDFMMSRFLPAAKAMTLQPPQHAPRKQSVLVAQPRDFTKLVGEEKKSFVNRRIITDIIPYTGQFQEEEEEESDHDTDDYANISAKGCGLFPRSCIKNSLCLLNQVSETNQFPMYSAYEVGKSDKSSHFCSYRSAPVIKKAWDVIHKIKSSSGATSPDKHEARKKWTSGSNRYNTYSGELKHLGRLSSFRRSGAAAAAGISPFGSKPPPSLSGTGLIGDSKQVENNKFGKVKFPSRGHARIQEVLSQEAKNSSDSRGLSMEKTLYIDTASTIKLPYSNSSSVGNSQRIDTIVRKERNSLDYLLHSLEDNLDSEIFGSADANSISLSSMSSLMAKEDNAERLTTDQEINRELIPLQLVQSSLDKDTKINNKQIVVVGDSGKADDKCVLHPLPPPLPKSPSESWLCRALPLVSLKNSLPYSSQGTQCHVKRPGFSRASSFSKWETIVKTSNFHHDHESCSRELTIYKSQHKKS